MQDYKHFYWNGCKLCMSSNPFHYYFEYDNIMIPIARRVSPNNNFIEVRNECLFISINLDRVLGESYKWAQLNSNVH